MKEVYSRRRSGHTMSAVFCRLDVHKESTYATVLGQDGEVITQKRMKNEEIPVFLEPLNVDKVAMEASTYIIPMYHRLVEEGYDVTVSHPKKTRYIGGRNQIRPGGLQSIGGAAEAELLARELHTTNGHSGST